MHNLYSSISTAPEHRNFLWARRLLRDKHLLLDNTATKSLFLVILLTIEDGG